MSFCVYMCGCSILNIFECAIARVLLVALQTAKNDMSSMCWPWQHGQAIADDKGPTARDLSIWGMGVEDFQMLEVGSD